MSFSGFNSTGSNSHHVLKPPLNLPAFVSKMYVIAETTPITILQWNDSGTTFLIVDQEAFCKHILNKNFTSKHFGSFVRQLNLYGFRKTKKDKLHLEFAHPYFLRGRPDLLGYVTKSSARSITSYNPYAPHQSPPPLTTSNNNTSFPNTQPPIPGIPVPVPMPSSSNSMNNTTVTSTELLAAKNEVQRLIAAIKKIVPALRVFDPTTTSSTSMKPPKKRLRMDSEEEIILRNNKNNSSIPIEGGDNVMELGISDAELISIMRRISVTSNKDNETMEREVASTITTSSADTTSGIENNKNDLTTTTNDAYIARRRSSDILDLLLPPMDDDDVVNVKTGNINHIPHVTPGGGLTYSNSALHSLNNLSAVNYLANHDLNETASYQNRRISSSTINTSTASIVYDDDGNIICEPPPKRDTSRAPVPTYAQYTTEHIHKKKWSYCIIGREEMLAAPFRLTVTEAGRKLADSTIAPPKAWAHVRATLIDWVYNLGGKACVGRFFDDGSFAEPITHRTLTWILDHPTSSGVQQVGFPGFIPLTVVRRDEDKIDVYDTTIPVNKICLCGRHYNDSTFILGVPQLHMERFPLPEEERFL